MGYCHRDIKLENLLHNKDDSVKICDFGLATPHSAPDGTAVPLTQKCGSIMYASPQAYHGWEYSCCTDVWSCGIVLYLLVVGEFPFAPNLKCPRFRLHYAG